jgi:hypothetical protein
MNNIQKISHTVTNNNSTSGHDVGVTWYEVVNPHWIASLDARGVEGMKSLRFNINMRQCCPELDHHDAINSVRRRDGRYFIEALDL